MAEELGHGHCEDVPDGDLRVLHVAVRNPGVSGDDSPRIVEMSDVVRTEPAEGEGVAWHSRATSHSTGPLSVVRGRRRNVPHEDGLGESHPLQAPFALVRHAHAVRVEMRLAAAGVASENHVAVLVRIHLPDVLVQLESIFVSDHVSLCFEV